MRRELTVLPTLVLIAQALVLWATAANSVEMYQPVKVLEADTLMFPKTAQRKGREGLIHYSLVVNPDGSQADVSLHYSIGGAVFEEQFSEWLKTNRFQPATVNGTPVAARRFGVVSFTLNGKTRGASSRFRGSWNRFTKALAKGDLAEARQHLDKLDANDSRSLYEELYLHQAWVLYLVAEGRFAETYPHLIVIDRFYKSRGATGEIVPPDFYYGPMLEKYQYEAQNVMLGDARNTLSTIRKLGPDQPNTSVVEEHFDEVLRISSGSETRIDAQLENLASSGATAVWDTALLGNTFSVLNAKGAIDSATVNCSNGQRSFDDVELDAVISVPREWGRCRLFVWGAPQTTFTLSQPPVDLGGMRVGPD